jgi:tetratricopeptide (TPR) repeat protein
MSEKDTLNAIRSLVDEGDLPAASERARRAIDGGLRHAFAYGVIALSLETSGRIDQAVQVLDEALGRFPDDLGCLQARGLCLLRLERFDAAREDFERVTLLSPHFAPGFTALGQAFEALGQLPAAEARYRRALALDATNIMAEAGLASVIGRRGEFAEARERALRVLASEPNYPPAAMVVGEADIAQNRAAEAESRMRALVQDPRVSDVERSLALSVLGDALDRQDRTTEAFAAYSESNQLRRTHYAPAFAGGQGTLAYAQSLREWFRKHPAKDLLPVVPPEVAESSLRGHVFLIGFPRSGTTLLEQVLAAHPFVVTLEERETLQDSVSAFMKRPADLSRLGLASEAELEPYRRLYWQRVAEAGVTVNRNLFIDKHPLNGLKLPLIARLFPGARILLTVRDPRDVVLSCFRRRFQMSAPYFEFLTLESTAALYDCVMQITHELIAQLQLSVHVVQLERLIGRFEHEVSAICTFLKIGWSDQMREFASSARARGVASASGAQIARGLNAGGVGEWRRYREHLAPVLPALDRWAEKFGY